MEDTELQRRVALLENDFKKPPGDFDKFETVPQQVARILSSQTEQKNIKTGIGQEGCGDQIHTEQNRGEEK